MTVSTVHSDTKFIMKKILFVCTGNTCRSPMAEAIFNSLSPDGFVSSSAGISTTNGRPVSENSVKALEEIKLFTSHTSVQIDNNIIKDYDYIIGITSNHAIMLSKFFPEYKDKIFSFPCEVSDPYGRDLAAYRKCRDLIIGGVEAIIKELNHAE